FKSHDVRMRVRPTRSIRPKALNIDAAAPEANARVIVNRRVIELAQQIKQVCIVHTENSLLIEQNVEPPPPKEHSHLQNWAVSVVTFPAQANPKRSGACTKPSAKDVSVHRANAMHFLG